VLSPFLLIVKIVKNASHLIAKLIQQTVQVRKRAYARSSGLDVLETPVIRCWDAGEEELHPRGERQISFFGTTIAWHERSFDLGIIFAVTDMGPCSSPSDMRDWKLEVIMKCAPLVLSSET
jgi:hypothetical protein